MNNKIIENIKDIYLYDNEYVMIIEVPNQRKVDYRLVKKEVFENLKNSDLDFYNSDLIEILTDTLDIKTYELAQRLRDLYNWYVISNEFQFDENDYLNKILNGIERPHKALEIIEILNRLGSN